MSGSNPTALRTREQFAVGNTDRHGFIGEDDELPRRPDISNWTLPTYYRRRYLAKFGQFAFDLEKPIVIEERHYDPVTHKLARAFDRELFSPEVIKRPAGTYISIRFSPLNQEHNPEIELADLDIDKDEDVG